MKTKSRLGKGLNALISNYEEKAIPQSVRDGVLEVEVERIEPNPFQPRMDFDPVALGELKASIKEKGIIQPIILRSIEDGRFQIIAGERRFRAALELGLKTVPAHIKKVENDEEMLEIALIENVQREHLNPIDLALGYQRLMEECHMTQEEVARTIGKDRSTVTNVIRLLKLPGKIQNSLRKGEIREGHARALLSISDPDIQELVWKKAVRQSLSVRKVEQLARKYQEKPEQAMKEVPKSRKSVFIGKLENKLREKFGTQVKIRTRKEGGSIEITFYSAEDLERLLEIFEHIKI